MPDVLRRHLAHGSPVLRIVPFSFRSLCAYVLAHHRHHKAPRGGKVFIGVVDAADTLQGGRDARAPVGTRLRRRHLLRGHALVRRGAGERE